jgi:phospholipid/cholesterol/gamma-HCH transport system substrate-binding protein
LFIELVPRSGDGPKLKDGDVIPADHATLPPDINTLLAQTNAGLQAIPHGDLKTVIDESYTAIGGLGPELARIVKGATTLAADARANLDSLTTVIDQSKPVLDSQINSSDSIRAWAANVAEVTRQLQEQDPALKGVLDRGPAATTEARQLIDRLEQILVLFPKDIEMLQAAQLANRDTKQDYKGLFLSFNLNANLPPPCTTGFLPAQQVRSPSEVDYPERPAGDMYCRVPQDSALDVRGARNAPCITRPGKRAPTVKLCESDEDYVPLNDGYNWKGDPNATLSGQSVPQQPPGTPPPAGPPAPPPIAVAQYDPATGTYTGPDGKQYTQTDLARDGRPRAWQDLLIPRGGD